MSEDLEEKAIRAAQTSLWFHHPKVHWSMLSNSIKTLMKECYKQGYLDAKAETVKE